MREIQIAVKDKVAKGDGTRYVCGNKDYQVRFAFDQEWEDVSVKTARFVKEDTRYTDVVFQGDVCPMPVLFGTKWVYVGVFAGDLQTTTPAAIRARRSILDLGGTPAEPSPDVYAQIMERLNGMEGGMVLPAGGAAGQALCKRSEADHDVAWQDPPQADLTGVATETYVQNYAQPKGDYALKKEIPAVPVRSVNGKTGAVSLMAADVGARPDTWTPTAAEIGALPGGTKIPAKTSELTNDSGFITGYTESDPTVPTWAKAASKPSYTKSEVGLGNVENVKQYSASNPPPYPVTKVNGKTGAVSLTAADVGAAPAANTLTVTGVDADGVTHTWVVYGVSG